MSDSKLRDATTLLPFSTAATALVLQHEQICYMHGRPASEADAEQLVEPDAELTRVGVWKQ